MVGCVRPGTRRATGRQHRELVCGLPM